ncbi:MAG: ABC transporter substrate-binding protein [Patescibacteria group bacterium]
MIFLKRKRLIIWLFKAYIKKWRKTIFLSFLFGLIVFFVLKYGVNYFIPLMPFTYRESIGMVGAYTSDNLPPEILFKLSTGLTRVDKDNNVLPSLANSWEIKNDGKKYIFYLKKNLYFSDGKKLTSSEIQYNFLDVKVERPNEYTIVFNLKNKYSPFLVTVSKPVFKKNFVGVGNFRVVSVNLNGNFVQSINLVSAKAGTKELSYQFYPTEEALKTAFVLGEVSKITGVKNIKFANTNLSKFPNANVVKKIDYAQLVTLFYNTKDKNLSDKKLRDALSYTIPNTFSQGQRNNTPFNPNSWAGKNGLAIRQQDLDRARLLLKDSVSSTQSASFEIEIKTLPQYKDLAEDVQGYWQEIGVKSKIKTADALPDTFQVFLGEFNVPKDPDQYSLWHSSHENNITNYKNLRIDKLLEDGRQTLDISERKKIYSDFQKYLLDDPPAIFLYFPYVYEITRK